MDSKKLAPALSVAGQISPQLMREIAEAGFRSIICNRPDGEEPGQPSFDEIRRAAEEAGLKAAYLPIPSGGDTAEAAAAFAELTERLPKPALAYCRSGARSAALWTRATAAAASPAPEAPRRPAPQRNVVGVRESGLGPYGQYVHVGRHVFGADEPGAMGGLGAGPDPFELVMAGLGACTTMTLRMAAARRRIPLEEARVEIRHLRAAPAAPGDKPHAFERLLTLRGPLTEEQRRALVEIADKCPVHKLLEGSAEIVTREARAEAGPL